MRNLAPRAWRCEHSATPSKFFQRDYSFRRQRPHFILKCTLNRTESSRVCFTRHSGDNLFLTRIPYESRQSKGCILRIVVHRQIAACSFGAELRRAAIHQVCGNWLPLTTCAQDRSCTTVGIAGAQSSKRALKPPATAGVCSTGLHFWQNATFFCACMARACAPQVGGW
jgi:hypothetical protein